MYAMKYCHQRHVNQMNMHESITTSNGVSFVSTNLPGSIRQLVVIRTTSVGFSVSFLTCNCLMVCSARCLNGS